eukprot:5311686-Pleurochrysis_carterae.AAC.1
MNARRRASSTETRSREEERGEEGRREGRRTSGRRKREKGRDVEKGGKGRENSGVEITWRTDDGAEEEEQYEE